MTVALVKRRGAEQRFDQRKVYGSVYSACMSAQMGERDCERNAESVSKDVTKWVNKKRKVTSQQIFEIVAKLLNRRSKEAAFMYETHRDIG